MGNINQFAQTLHTTMIPEVTCFILHLFCAGALIGYLHNNKLKTPIIQNSPILTISAQVMLVISSLCLFVGKLLYIDRNPDGEELVGRGCCVADDNVAAAVLNMLYTFCLEYMYMSYLFKMVRVIFITFEQSTLQTWQKILSSEYLMMLASAIWGLLITIADLFMKIFMYDKHQSNGLHLYPQFNQFLCDMPYKDDYSLFFTIIYNTKLFIYLGLFLWSFCYSYRLEEIDDDLRLRFQYFILLLLPFSVMITDKIFKVIDPNINTSMPVHYVDCFSNLLAGFVLMGLHFNVAKQTDFSLPDQNDFSQLNVDVVDLHYIFDKQEIRETVRGYFQFRGRAELFQVQLEILKVDHLNNNVEEKVERILQGLNEDQKKQVLKSKFRRFETAKDKVDKSVRKILDDWKDTLSGHTLIQKLKKNGCYYKKMQKLNLVNKNSLNPLQYYSETEVILSN